MFDDALRFIVQRLHTIRERRTLRRLGSHDAALARVRILLDLDKPMTVAPVEVAEVADHLIALFAHVLVRRYLADGSSRQRRGAAANGA